MTTTSLEVGRTDFAHAGIETFSHSVLVVVTREADDDGLSMLFLDVLIDNASRLYAIHDRHEDVHENKRVSATAHSFPRCKGLLKGLFPIICLTFARLFTVSQLMCSRSM